MKIVQGTRIFSCLFQKGQSMNRDVALKKYAKKMEYSYTLGAFPTIELLKNQPERVLKVLLHPDMDSQIQLEIMEGLCKQHKIPLEWAGKSVEKIRDKENIFAVGVFLGVMFINQSKDKSEVEKYINTYVDETKSLQDGEYFSELQKDIKGNIALALLLWFAGTTIIGIPIVLGIIMFRGFCLGYTIASCVYVFGRIKGLIFIAITILLQNIIFIPAMMILGVSSIKLYKSIVKDRRKENIKLSIIKHSLTSVIILIVLIISSIIKIKISYIFIFNLIKYF